MNKPNHRATHRRCGICEPHLTRAIELFVSYHSKFPTLFRVLHATPSAPSCSLSYWSKCPAVFIFLPYQVPYHVFVSYHYKCPPAHVSCPIKHPTIFSVILLQMPYHFSCCFGLLGFLPGLWCPEKDHVQEPHQLVQGAERVQTGDSMLCGSQQNRWWVSSFIVHITVFIYFDCSESAFHTNRPNREALFHSLI